MKPILITVLASMLLLLGCSSKNKKTMAGAGIGTAVGAGVGAIFGKEKGALLGAAIGGGLGAYAGHRMDKQAAELEKIAETRRTEQGLVTKLKSDILFDTGKANLKAVARDNLKEMATIMKKYPENVLTVKGYTDSTGSDAVNEKLSTQRAEAVRKELSVAGLPVQALSAIGLGPSNPLADNSTASGRSQNRRVEIEVTVDESKIPKEKKKKS
ncbi:MAG TPA: OmpA family protein [Bacteriovoracaceae bacterium]|nr:OmpA family protein [Bacteriovoracaceae bacterium]